MKPSATGSSERLRTLLAKLEKSSKASGLEDFRPEIFDASEDQDRLAVLIESGLVRTYRDRYLSQLRALGVTRHASDEDFATTQADAWVEAQLGTNEPATKGVYVYYPWSGALVHILGQREYFELRTNRNCYKVTPDEQSSLWRRTIGVVGLSVGHAAATTLALEGIGGRLRLADYDELELSNLNRIRTRLEMLGLNKAVIAARELYEINPYLEVEIFRQGINSENIESFLRGAPQLDLLVEECDDLFAKIRLRERARALGIPVIMDTSDRGMLDIERFDAEPTRPIFHGLLGDLKAKDVLGLSMKEKIPHVFRIVGEKNVSPRLAASMLEVKQSLYTWPQLGSDVALGGALVAHGARRILLGEETASGRYFVDLDQALNAGPSLATADDSQEDAAMPCEVPSFEFDPTVPVDVSQEDAVRWLVAAAHLAPSGGNQQPWRFSLMGGMRISLSPDPQRRRTFLDYRDLATEVALGAATENLSIAASHLGLRAEVLERSADAREIYLHAEDEIAPDPLLSAIPKRATERRQDPQITLPPHALDALRAASQGPAGTLYLTSDRGDIACVAELVAEADRFAYLHETTHRELMEELRWSDREARHYRDGIRVGELELTAFDEAGLRLVRRPSTVRLVKAFGGGAGMGDLSCRWFEGSAAVGLFVASGRTRQDAFAGGRAIQRIWLTASKLGVGLHPLTALLYLGTRAEEDGEGLDEQERTHLAHLVSQVRKIFGSVDGNVPLLLFRLVPATNTRTHLRKPLDDVFTTTSK